VRRAPIARRAGRQNGGLLVDAWHYFRGTDNEAALRALPAERIIAVQFDDVDAPQARPARTRSAGYYRARARSTMRRRHVLTERTKYSKRSKRSGHPVGRAAGRPMRSTPRVLGGASMEPSILIALCWLLFAATHIGLASRRVRPALVARLGPSSFSYLFSFVAIVTFGLLLHVLSLHQHAGAAGPDLGRFPPVRAIGIVTITTGVVLTIAALQSPPASMLALFIPAGVKEPYGLERVTRHPFFIGTALLGIGHVLLASRMVGVVAFGGLAIYSIAGAMHQDGKLRRELGEQFAAYLDQTSLVPFAAIVAGRQRLVAQELPLAGIAVGLLLAFALRSVHSSILADGGAWAIGVMVLGPLVATWLTLLLRRRSRRTRGHADASRVTT
jgi:uncharacterized membrane protein